MGSSFGRRILAAGILLVITLLLYPAFDVVSSFPDEVRVFQGEQPTLDVGPFFSLFVPQDIGSDSYEVELRLLGRIPLRKAAVSVVSEMYVVPGGQSVGILTNATGVTVVRTPVIVTRTGEERSPAAEAGIRPGDIIVKVGDTSVTHPLDVETAMDWYGSRNQSIPLVVRRGDREMQLTLTPVRASFSRSGRDVYMMGAELKDPAAGVGTLTFWDPKSKLYGALGHQISDEGEVMPLHDGAIVPAVIHGIQPGSRGRPGEKMGIFEHGPSLGTIDKNTPFGIFGRLAHEPVSIHPPVPIALSQEVKLGEAQMLTVLEGNRVQSFAIDIVAVYSQARPSGKGLVIRVVDPVLLARTNGIVQGMSGSPILQDGKLIGAVTHVFVNDPTRGFGVLAEWMVYEAGLATWSDELGSPSMAM